MTPDEQRVAKANEIAANPHLYLVCCACQSIMKKPSHYCAVCGNYGFTDDPAYVKSVAMKLAMEKPKTIRPDDLK